MAKGTTINLSAIGFYNDNTTQDITARTTFESSDSSLAYVQDGVLQALDEGTITLTATYAYGSESSSTTVIISAASISSIAFTPASPKIYVNNRLQMKAEATYTDGSVIDITDKGIWGSEDETKALVNNSWPKGMVSALAAGTVAVSISYQGSFASVDTSLVSATLNTITLNASSELPIGAEEQITVTGNFSDASTQDLTSQAVFSVNEPTRLLVDASPGRRGIATALTAGATVVTAKVGGVSNTANITVTSATPTGVTIQTPTTTIGIGNTLDDFYARVTYSDASTKDFPLDLVSHGIIRWTSVNTSSNDIAPVYGQKIIKEWKEPYIDKYGKIDYARSITRRIVEPYFSGYKVLKMPSGNNGGGGDPDFAITASINGQTATAYIDVTAIAATSVYIEQRQPTVATSNSVFLTSRAWFSDGTKALSTEEGTWGVCGNEFATGHAACGGEDDSALVTHAGNGQFTAGASNGQARIVYSRDGKWDMVLLNIGSVTGYTLNYPNGGGDDFTLYGDNNRIGHCGVRFQLLADYGGPTVNVTEKATWEVSGPCAKFSTEQIGDLWGLCHTSSSQSAGAITVTVTYGSYTETITGYTTNTQGSADCDVNP